MAKEQGLSRRERVMMIIIALLLLLLSLLLAQGDALPIHLAATIKPENIGFENTLHAAAALGSLTLFLAVHQALQSSGFTLGRGFNCTDSWISVGIIILTTVWTGLVFTSGLITGTKPCSQPLSTQCFSRLSFVPWLLVVLCMAWAIWFMDSYIHQEARRGASDRIGLWKMNVEEGPYSWKESLAPWFLYLIYTCQLFFISITSYGAVVEGEYTIAILNVIGLALVVIGAGGKNPYSSSPVRYKGNNIRIPLSTTFNAKTVYILPSQTHGFDAVWSAKLSFEHKELDQNLLNWFGTVLDQSSSIWSLYQCSVITKTIITAHSNRALSITDAELEALARWIYDCDVAGRPAVKRSIRADRQDGINLVGKDLLFALMSTEYLVYSVRHRLPLSLQTTYARLRSTRFDGAENSPKTEVLAIGFDKRAKEGYRNAVRHLYQIFQIDPDASAMDPKGTPPSYSRALRYTPIDIDDYVSRLWDMCIDNAAEITTFGALFNFAVLWYLEVGEGNGFHIYPFKPKNGSYQGDLTMWQIIWRQAWYSVTMAQFVTMSPTIISAFIGGVIQGKG